jgi:hypothetical protein
MYRFDWRPVLGSFPNANAPINPTDIESRVLIENSAWRWTFDPYPVTTGRALWRIANGIRVLSILEVFAEEGIIHEWVAQWGTVLLAVGGTNPRSGTVVTQDFATLVAGEPGSTVFDMLKAQFGEVVAREDEAQRESERKSSLIASFVVDQLAVRPPISSDEIEALKRRLGIS